MLGTTPNTMNTVEPRFSTTLVLRPPHNKDYFPAVPKTAFQCYIVLEIRPSLKLDSRLLCNAMGHPGWPRKYPL